MHIRMSSIVGSDVAAGARSGRIVLTEILSNLDEPQSGPEVVYLDFEGIEVATASFLRECVLEFKDLVRRRWASYYPVLANASDSVREELDVLVQSMRDVVVVCQLDQDEQSKAMRLIGNLEPKQQETLEIAVELGEVSASELAGRQTSTERISQTAWNNRLASLNKLGLLIEVNQDRSKQYRPLPIGF